jgi:hypothetical protein
LLRFSLSPNPRSGSCAEIFISPHSGHAMPHYNRGAPSSFDSSCAEAYDLLKPTNFRDCVDIKIFTHLQFHSKLGKAMRASVSTVSASGVASLGILIHSSMRRGLLNLVLAIVVQAQF